MNQPQCFNCGAETDCDDEIGRRKVYVCSSKSCARELRDSQREIEQNVRDRAEQDGYDRYR